MVRLNHKTQHEQKDKLAKQGDWLLKDISTTEKEELSAPVIAAAQTWSCTNMNTNHITLSWSIFLLQDFCEFGVSVVESTFILPVVAFWC